MTDTTSTVTRITPDTTRELPAADALVEMARDLMAAQARGPMPTIRMSQDGRITLRWDDGTRVSYATGTDTGPVPRDAAPGARREHAGGGTPDPTAGPLGIADVVELSAILLSTSGKPRVARMIDGERFVGHARSVVREHGKLAPPRPGVDDVRACHLHVTGSFGDHFWPIAELMAELATGDFTTDYHEPDQD